MSQLTEAVRLAPHDARFHDSLGQAYRQAGESPAAGAAFREAIRRDPREPRYRIHLAGLLLEDGRLPEAVAAFRCAVDLAPRSVALRIVLARTLERSGWVDEGVAQYAEAARLAAPFDRDGALAELTREELRAAQGLLGQRRDAGIPAGSR